MITKIDKFGNPRTYKDYDGMCKHISESLKGMRCGLGNKSRTGQKRSPEEVAKGIATKRAMGILKHTEETKRKMSKKKRSYHREYTYSGWHHSEETKRKYSEQRKGRKISDEGRANISKGKIGHKVSEECRQKLRDYWAKHKEEQRLIGLKAWFNGEKTNTMLQNMLKSRGVKPNKTETYILEILDEYYPYEWSYVGDGNFAIGGKCPDFKRNHGHNQLIEYYGDYWHEGENEQERIDHFRKHGYETVIIWESQIENKSKQEIYELIDGKLKELPVCQ